ncbi:MAG: lipopolysaccharide transport system permease protein [Blastocatellia bacterium]
MQVASDESRTAPPDHQAGELPRQPVVLIEANRRWAALDFAALWQYRELFYFLMWRDVKVRYKQTMFGVLWAILQPLVTMLIFTYFFGRLARVPADGIPYPLFFYAGLVLWTFFSNAVSNAANSLLGNTNLITKVYFPRIIIPGATVGAGLLDFAIAAALLVGLLFAYRFPLTKGDLLLLPLVLLVTLLAFAVGVLLAALNVRYRDIRYALPFLINIWMFVSPIIYPSSLVPAEWRWVLALNPVTGIVEAFRASLFERPVAWGPLAYSAGFTLVLLGVASVAFQQMERYFAEDI